MINTSHWEEIVVEGDLEEKLVCLLIKIFFFFFFHLNLKKTGVSQAKVKTNSSRRCFSHFFLILTFSVVHFELLSIFFFGGFYLRI